MAKKANVPPFFFSFTYAKCRPAASRLVKIQKNQRIPNLFKLLLRLPKIFIICKKVQNKTNNQATINQNP